MAGDSHLRGHGAVPTTNADEKTVSTHPIKRALRQSFEELSLCSYPDTEPHLRKRSWHRSLRCESNRPRVRLRRAWVVPASTLEELAVVSETVQCTAGATNMLGDQHDHKNKK